MSEIKLFPGPFLYIEEIENHFEIKQKIVSFIENDISKNDWTYSKQGTKVKTSYFSGKSNKEFLEFTNTIGVIDDVVWSPLDKCFSKLPFITDCHPQSSKISDLWYNYFEEGGSHKPHTHSDSFISGIYILHLEEKNSTVFFGSGQNNSPFYNFVHQTDYVREGTIILFPSDMWHYVDNIHSKRITISFNIITSFA